MNVVNEENPIAEPSLKSDASTNPKPPLKSLKWIKFSIPAILLLVILVLSGIYLFLNSNKQVACTTEAKLCPDGSSIGRTGPNCEFSKCPETTPTSTTTVTPPITSNWKTYNLSGITFKLPQNWKEYEIGGPGHPYDVHLFATSSNASPDKNLEDLEIGYWTDHFTYQDLLNKYKQFNAKNYPINEQVVVDGRKCLLSTSSKPMGQGSLNPPLIDTYLYFIDCEYVNNKAFTFTFSSKNHKADDLLKTILSTFKFTDQTIKTDSSGLKTYTDSRFDYSFKFPSNLYQDTSVNTFLRLSPATVFNPKTQEDYKAIGYEIMVEVGPQTIDLSGLEDNYKELFGKTAGFNISHTKVDDIEALKVASCTDMSDVQKDCVVFFNNVHQYDISIVYHTDNPSIKSQGRKAFDQILSTFKFTDQTSPTPTCRPRPACLDSEPRCMIAETKDMCPPTVTPTQ